MAREKPIIITADDVMNFTSGGKDIFVKELGSISNKNIKSPLRNDGSIPSFRVSQSSKSGIFCFQDFGGSNDRGNAITFISKLYNITYAQAIEKIALDFGMKKGEASYKKKTFIETVIPKKETLIEFNTIPFTDKHLKYWDKSEIPESFLNSKNIWAISTYAINKKVINIPQNQYCFAYYAPDIDKVKILTLGENVKLKWLNNAPNSYLFGYHDLQSSNCEEVWVCKSYKDAVLMEYHFGKCVLACQNESHKMIMQNKDKIENISKNVVILYGSDPQANREAKKIQKDTGWKSFHTPFNLYSKKNVEDPFDFLQHYSVQDLKLLLKEQKLL